MTSWRTRTISSVGPRWISCGSPARSVRGTDSSLPVSPPHPPVPTGRWRPFVRGPFMPVSTLLSDLPLRPDTGRPPIDPAHRRTGAAGLAAALAAASDRWLPLVEYRPTSRWTHLLPRGDAASLLDPELHADLAGAQVW